MTLFLRNSLQTLNRMASLSRRDPDWFTNCARKGELFKNIDRILSDDRWEVQHQCIKFLQEAMATFGSVSGSNCFPITSSRFLEEPNEGRGGAMFPFSIRKRVPSFLCLKHLVFLIYANIEVDTYPYRSYLHVSDLVLHPNKEVKRLPDENVHCGLTRNRC